MQIRKIISEFEPYEWEPSNRELASEVGLKPEQMIRFDTNSSPYQPVELLRMLSERVEKLRVNEYPDTSYDSLRTALSRYTDLSKDSITVTNGADESLDIIAKTFLNPSDEIILPVPTYVMFRIVSEILGAKIIRVRRDEAFQEDAEAILKAVSDRTKMIFLCSPNNPTGNCSKEATVIRLLEDSNALVAVDESYYEFCDKTFASLTNNYDNLVLIRTFSKAFSMAGVRVGYTIASKKTIDLLNRVRPPNSLSIISLTLAELALEHSNLMRRNVELNKTERERLRRAFLETGKMTVYPSEANFLLTRFRDVSAPRVAEKFLRKGIVVRDVGTLPGLENCLRFSVRTHGENDLLLQPLPEALAS